MANNKAIIGVIGLIVGGVTVGAGLLPPWHTRPDIILNLMCIAVGSAAVWVSADWLGQYPVERDS